MQRKVEQWTTALAVIAIVAVLLACKKRTSPTAPAAETAAAVPTTPPTAAVPGTPAPALAAADPSSPKLGEVKRYPDKEKAQTGAVRTLAADVKVYNEADDRTAEVATLSKDLLVFRIASVPDYELVEFPSGIGKVSPGWVRAQFIDAKASSNVERAAVGAQSAQAVVKVAPKASASAAAKPATSAVASAKPATDKAAADKAAADKAAADKAAADKAAARAKAIFDRTKRAAEAAAAGK
jgi:colicin import membrane protein